MKVLIIGSGGREHALAWKISHSPKVQEIFVASGNAGTARELKTKNIAINAENIDELVNFAQKNAIDLTIVGPEMPLVLGIVDAFQMANLRCFGPTQAAAQLEGSKAFTKDFLARHHIPTAEYGNFTDIEEAIDYIHKIGAPIVVKADGLAAGKGVILAQTEEEAIRAVKNMLSGQSFGESGKRVVIEEFLKGEEASFICMVDGKHILPLATSQDHKARDDGDKGPNTGGMGAYSPAPVVTADIHAQIMREIIEPTVRGMAAEGYPYTGFLYAGLMIDSKGKAKVLEYNCRFGDPEAQPIMLRLRSDLVELCEATLEKRLHTVTVEWDSRVAVGVVLAEKGYPENYKKGSIIPYLSTLAEGEGKIFHAGTTEESGQIVTAGGRVLCACGLGNTVKQAQSRAYDLVKQIAWESAYYRSDIGYRAVNRESL
jgi:phosphoribosylamine--glycine ligase